ncbi:MAG: hypothetical protein SC6F7.25c, partial [uncultured Blastococcus sp.]
WFPAGTATPRAAPATHAPATPWAAPCPTAPWARTGRRKESCASRHGLSPRRRSCWTPAAPSTRTRCSRTPGSPRPKPSASCGAAWHSSRSGSPTPHGATPAERRRCWIAERAPSAPTWPRRTGSTSRGWSGGRGHWRPTRPRNVPSTCGRPGWRSRALADCRKAEETSRR